MACAARGIGASFSSAATDGTLSAVALIGSLLIGAALMASPVVLLLIKGKP